MSFLTSRTLLRSNTPSLLRSTTAPSTITRRHLARMTIVGRLADSPEIVPTSTGQDVVRYALGTSHGPKDNRQTSWWRVACFAPEGGLRDLVLGLGKGSMVCVEGDCSMNKYTAKDGSQQSSLSIVQKNLEILERRESQGGAEEAPGQ